MERLHRRLLTLSRGLAAHEERAQPRHNLQALHVLISLFRFQGGEKLAERACDRGLHVQRHLPY